jgi:hypothetical protein
MLSTPGEGPRARACPPLTFFGAVLAAVLCCTVAVAQDLNILLPVGEIERALAGGDLEIVDTVDNRFEGDRTQRVVLRLSDGSLIKVKWAVFATGGEAFNNMPRYEIAAYELQKLFLDEAEYVVPPTLARAFDLAWCQTTYPDAEPTFKGTSSVLVALQYWLWNVEDFENLDRRRFRNDPAYARSIANFNVFTYLALHSDSNMGNSLISRESSHPRVFAVDNGVTFGKEETDQGTEWRWLAVDRLPRSTVERLRKIDTGDLESALAVVAQFNNEDGRLVAVEPTEPFGWNRGTRWQAEVLQLGLTALEIRGVHTRLKRLLKRVDAGKIKTF